MFKFEPTFDLSNLNGKNGFTINGTMEQHSIGDSVSKAGDINGDGIADIIIGAPGMSSSYVVFGKKIAWNASLDVMTLNGKNGFVIQGVSGSDVGSSVSAAGDVNGDGIGDIVIGDPSASPNGNYEAGSSYVVFGKKAAWSALLEVSKLDGKNGFVINGVSEGDLSGSSVSEAGDVNGDGITDIIIGAPNASPTASSYEAGSSYVVFGKKAAWKASLDLSTLNGKNGFVINGDVLESHSGGSVSTAGDVNGDGIADIIIGADNIMDPDGYKVASSYVVFGKKTAWNASLNVSALNGKNGFVINRVDGYVHCPNAVSAAGDVNGDDIADVIIGSFCASADGNNYAGTSYAVFGKKAAWEASLDLSILNGENGFAINGVNVNDASGYSVNTAGDINGDGITDIIIGAIGTSPDGRTSAGSSYIVFGKKTAWNASIELSALNGENGFVANGISIDGVAGSAVSNAGDINGDGITDVIIGAPNANSVPYRINTGASYVVFGQSSSPGFFSPYRATSESINMATNLGLKP